MTERQRVIRNIFATYGRSLYALILGLFSARWLLESLGQTDYGLYGVIGGMTAFIAFFNNLLASAIGRFYAYSIGAASVAKDRNEGLEECRRWFNIALMIHTVIPGTLILVGYPLGIWAIHHWLIIPLERVEACIWVFRFVCMTCFIGMLNVPFQAFYTAKQLIAELTVYSVISTTIHFLLLCFMIEHPGEWLVPYACCAMLIAIIPQGLICLNAWRKFPECRIHLRYCLDYSRLKVLVVFAFWQFFGAIGSLARGQALAILVNKAFGPIYNTSMAISNSVASHADSLSAALRGAFSPVITTSEGAGNHKRMLQMCYRSSVFGGVLCLIFVNPVIVECDTLLQLWLKTPPPYVTDACRIVLLMLTFNQFYYGLDLAIVASGKTGLCNSVVGIFQLFSLPVSVLLIFYYKCSFISIFYVLLFWKVAVAFVSLPIVRRITGYSIRLFCFRLLLPTFFCMGITLTVAFYVRQLLSDFYWIRLCAVGISCELVFLPCAFFFLLQREDRRVFLNLLFHRKV